MRILLLANAMNTLSGGDKRFIELSRRWGELGHSVTVMTTPLGCDICRKEHLDARYLILPGRFVDRLDQITCNLIRTLIACFVVLSKSADVVYSTSDFLNDVLPALIIRCIVRRQSDLRWVAATFYLVPPPWRRRGQRLANAFAYLAQRLALLMFKIGPDLVITNTFLLAHELRQNGVTKPIEVLPNGIDTELVDSIPASDSFSDAVFVARMKSSKGPLDAILVWERVVKRLPEAVLAMIGSSDLKTIESLKKEIHNRGLDSNVVLLGFASSRTVYSMMKSSKLLMYMDTESGWGITICEAMACRLPVVAYDLPVFREVYGDAVDFVPPGDIARFSETVLSLLSSTDARLRKADGIREVVRKYDWNKIARDEIKILERTRAS